MSKHKNHKKSKQPKPTKVEPIKQNTTESKENEQIKKETVESKATDTKVAPHSTDTQDENDKSSIKLSTIIYITIAIIFIAIGIILKKHTNEYNLTNHTTEKIVGHSIETQNFYTIDPTNNIMVILSESSFTFGITFFITIFFVSSFEKREKVAFKEEIKAIQTKTAQNAFLSLFKTLIDPSYLSVIENDIIRCPLIRSNARWQYKITFDTATKNFTLNRTITYSLKNVTTEIHNESFSIKCLENDYMSLKVLQKKIRRNSSDYSDHNSDDIEIKANETLDVLLCFEQTFKTPDFLYETHFTRFPLINLELDVTLPSNCNFNLSAATLEHDCIKIAEDHYLYKFKSAILKGQGIEFSCERKKESSTST